MSTPADNFRPESRILVVTGSPRAGGNSDILANQIVSGAGLERIDADIIHLRERHFSPCIGCERCRRTAECIRFNDGMTPLYEMIRRAQGIALVSPVHNYNVTAWIKAFIDRLYCFYEFEGSRPGPWHSRLAGEHRMAVFAAVAEQPDISDAGVTLEAMRKPLEALGYEIVDEVLALGIFNKGGISKRPETLTAAKRAGRLLGESIRKC